jgi:hypothetical protein
MTLSDEDFGAGIAEALAIGREAKSKGKAKAVPMLLVKEVAPPDEPLDPNAPPYTPDAMVALMLEKPNATEKQLAAHFGKPKSWFFAVLASDRFQLALAPHKESIANPSWTASMDERFKAIAVKSLSVMGEKLESKEVSEFLVTKAAEISIKALGYGTPQQLPPPVAAISGPEVVAERILAAMEKAKARSNSLAIDVEVKVKSD